MTLKKADFQKVRSNISKVLSLTRPLFSAVLSNPKYQRKASLKPVHVVLRKKKGQRMREMREKQILNTCRQFQTILTTSENTPMANRKAYLNSKMWKKVEFKLCILWILPPFIECQKEKKKPLQCLRSILQCGRVLTLSGFLTHKARKME